MKLVPLKCKILVPRSDKQNTQHRWFSPSMCLSASVSALAFSQSHNSVFFLVSSDLQVNLVFCLLDIILNSSTGGSSFHCKSPIGGFGSITRSQVILFKEVPSRRCITSLHPGGNEVTERELFVKIAIQRVFL